VFDDNWIREVGFLDPPRGLVRDLMDHETPPAPVITASLGEAIDGVVRKMRQHGISQLPVLGETELVGMITERELIHPLLEGAMRAEDPIDPLVSPAFTVVSPTDPVDRLPEIFQRGEAAVVVEENALRGIITQIDLISYLSRG
jgi:cystathionine beta-synthase